MSKLLRLLRGNVGVGDHWVLLEMDRSIDAHLDRMRTTELSAVEISGTEIIDRHEWRNASTLSYPGFDICEPRNSGDRYDVVICNQVLEHVVDPWQAARTLRSLCRPGGLVIAGVPFMLRIHPAPLDLWRFTPAGLEHLLRSADLEVLEIHGWGNAACVRANLYSWAPHRRWRPMHNDGSLPVAVWAFATPAGGGTSGRAMQAPCPWP